MKFTKYILAALVLTIVACNRDGFKTTKSGIKYKFFREKKDGQKAQLGDILELKMKYATPDTVVFNSDTYAKSIPFQLMKPGYVGDIVEGIGMMAVGDSAAFIVSADSFFIKNVGLKELPKFIKKGSMLTFNISVLSVKKKEVYEKEQMELKKQKSAMLEVQRNDEAGLRDAYLKKNNVKAKPTKSGLYFTETQKGKGKQAVVGANVQVHYKGSLLNGSEFDSSYKRDKPISFKLGGGQVIPGFEEGVTMMKEGSKAQLIIPSDLGYKDQELENIPAYSTLIYEVELVKVD